MKLHYHNSQIPLKKLEKGHLGKLETLPGTIHQVHGLRHKTISPVTIRCRNSITIVADTQLTPSLESMAGELEQQPMMFFQWLELSNGRTPTVV